MFQLHLRIIKAKLELQQFQEALDYSINLQIPKDQQAFIDLGLIFCDYDQTFDKQYIWNGVDLSQNKYETLKQLIKQCSATRINKFFLQYAILMDGNDSELEVAYADHMKNWDGTLEEKIDAFKRAISLNPQSDDFYHHLIEAQTKLDKIQDGIDFMKGLNNTGIQLYLELGRLLLQINQVEEAIKQLNLAIGLDNSENYQCLIVFMLYEHKYYEQYINKCEEFQLFDQKSSFTFLYKAKSFICLGKQKEPYRIFKKDYKTSYCRVVQQ